MFWRSLLRSYVLSLSNISKWCLCKSDAEGQAEDGLGDLTRYDYDLVADDHSLPGLTGFVVTCNYRRYESFCACRQGQRKHSCLRPVQPAVAGRKAQHVKPQT